RSNAKWLLFRARSCTSDGFFVSASPLASLRIPSDKHASMATAFLARRRFFVMGCPFRTANIHGSRVRRCLPPFGLPNCNNTRLPSRRNVLGPRGPAYSDGRRGGHAAQGGQVLTRK